MTRITPLGSTKDRKVKYNEGEKNLATKLGGRRQPGSGAIDGFKGDVITREFLIDQKTTEHSSFRITGGVLNKITYEARQAGKHPAIEIELCVAPSTPKEWMLIPLDVFNEYRKLSDAIEKGEVKKKEDSEDRDDEGASAGDTESCDSGTRDSGSALRGSDTRNTGGTAPSDARRDPPREPIEDVDDEIIEAEVKGKEKKEKGKDSRIGDARYNNVGGSGGIKFEF